MREDICSIPISEIFEPKDGCPFCRMRDMLEDRMATYITGAAMMEPDVRVETNRLGFCHQHFEQILQRGQPPVRRPYSRKSLRRSRQRYPARGRQARAEKNSRRRRSPCAQLLCLRKR